MPHKPYWWKEIPTIRRQLEVLSEPVLPRRAIQSLFRVSHMEAQRIMRRVGCWKVGVQLVVSRPRLLEWLATVEKGSAYLEEIERRGNLERKLEDARRAAPGERVRIPVPEVSRRLEGLPGGVHLVPGELRIEFFGTEDLLQHLYQLSQAILGDYKRFEKLCGD